MRKDKQPVWVTDPYTGQTYNLEPLFSHLNMCHDKLSETPGFSVLRRILCRLAETAHENFSHEGAFEDSYKDIVQFNHMLWMTINMLDRINVKVG